MRSMCKKYRRKAAALLLGLMAFPALLYAQEAEETVAVASDILPESDFTTSFYFLLGLAILQIIVMIVLADSMKMIVRVRAQDEKKKKDEEKKKSGGGTAVATIAILIFSLTSTNLFAASDSTDHLLPLDEMSIYALVGVNVVLLCVNIYFMSLIKQFSNTMLTVREVAVKQRQSAWSRWMATLTAAVPIESEDDVMMDHEYDGIHELDNRLPPWWLYGFYLSIVVAVFYFSYYHVFGVGLSSAEAYTEAMAEADEEVKAYLAAKALNVDEYTAVVMVNPADIEAGKKIFVRNNCGSCHGTMGEGGTGPAFADNYWLHGGDIKDIFKTIKYGKPSKGMVAWEGKITPVGMQQVASYILTFQGTNPPNLKEPQGDLHVPEEEGADAVSDSLAAPEVLVPDSMAVDSIQ